MKGKNNNFFLIRFDLVIYYETPTLCLFTIKSLESIFLGVIRNLVWLDSMFLFISVAILYFE